MPIVRSLSWIVAALIAGVWIAGCQAPPKKPQGDASATAQGNGEGPPGRLQVADFSDPLRVSATNGPVVLRAGRNETISFAVQINEFPALNGKTAPVLRVTGLKHAEAVAEGTPAEGAQTNGARVIEASGVAGYQVLPMPIDANRAGFVRHTGLSVTSQRLPRALLPLGLNNGEASLAAMRNGAEPANAQARADTPGAPAPVIWYDLQVPPTVAAGEYRGSVELVENGKVTSAIGVTLLVDDFVLPDERHLGMVGLLDWEGLARLYPQQFQGVRPHLLSKQDPQTAPAIQVIDQVVKLAQAHRVQVIVPALQPVVKWPTGTAPAVDWGEFDAIVGPWLSGDAFADSVPLNYWPLPFVEHLELHGSADRNAYWLAAASHFDQAGWLTRAGVAIERQEAGRVRIEETIELSEQAAAMLNLHPGLRVSLPLEEDQIQLATPTALRRIDPAALNRVSYLAPGQVAAPPLQRLPKDSGATRWLRTDLGGLVPYAGAGAHDREVRLWAWLAFLRDAQLVRWPSVLPAQSNVSEPAGPDELVWFYPGSWFGVDAPVPTIQLKWLRRAEQDFEYLWLARQRGQGERAQVLARLLTRPVQMQPAQDADPVYGLLSGTSDPKAWADALDLLSRTILLSQPGQAMDPAAENALRIQTTAWVKSQDRPMLLARSAEWIAGTNPNQLDLRLLVDVYNTAEQPPGDSRLRWNALPEGWQATGSGAEVPPQAPYTVNAFPLLARVDLNQVSGANGAANRKPVVVNYVESETNRPYSLRAMLPAAWSEQRLGGALKVDGNLVDWHPGDAFHAGPMVQMLTRPAVQRQELRPAGTSSTIYSCWTPASLYLGFKVDGADAPLSNAERSFVDYEFRRAWGEDLCEILVQPVYADNTPGPLFHIVVKPRGQITLKRRLDPRLNVNPWQAFAGVGIAYASVAEKTVWRGELQIPWDDLSDPEHAGQRPVLLRFNFAQHRATTGESASWAGPVDFGQDESIMGVLQVRKPDPLDRLPSATTR